MEKFEEKKFNIGVLKGTSSKNTEGHLKLYVGYVKNVNVVIEKISELSSDPEKNMYLLGELLRRFSFEWNGMRNHEIYFELLSGGAKPLRKESELYEMIVKTYESFETFISRFKNLAMTRGIGWAVLWYDTKDKRLLASWVDEQHLGQLNGCEMILALDMWEHAYITDYQPSEKKQYIEDFFVNVNWEIAEKIFIEVQ